MDKLKQAAVDALRGKTPQEALESFAVTVVADDALLNQLCLEYLVNVAAGQKPRETHYAAAGATTAAPSQPSIDTHAAHADAAAGGEETNLCVNPTVLLSPPPQPPAKPDKPVKVHAHRRASPGEKAAERAAWLMQADAIYETRKISDRAIGSIQYAQVGAMVADNARNAASYLRLGTEATADAILLDKIAKHCTPARDTMTVREMLTPALLKRFDEESRMEAPVLIERGMRQYAETIQNREIEHVA